MRSLLSPSHSYGPIREDGWPRFMPPLADHTTAYLAAQIRLADEVAELTSVRRLTEAGIGSSPGSLVMLEMRHTVGAGLVRIGERLWGGGLDSIERQLGRPASLGFFRRCLTTSAH
jgi:hypothetical protein